MRLRHFALWLGIQTPVIFGIAAAVLGSPVIPFIATGIVIGAIQASMIYVIGKRGLSSWEW
jgi:uncharacterized protein (DUF697 family)